MDTKQMEKIRKDNNEIPVFDGWVQMSNFFYGYVYNDVNRKNGTIIKTSRTYSVDFENGILVTQNATYNLGREAKKT